MLDVISEMKMGPVSIASEACLHNSTENSNVFLNLLDLLFCTIHSFFSTAISESIHNQTGS